MADAVMVVNHAHLVAMRAGIGGNGAQDGQGDSGKNDLLHR
jgi:hypothetical protein